ncbi:SDR family oxidoreductase [uncultured Kocuria sp.]|uniref:SDR family oxidoreductase n=1 Tax=uncultured Kocuria sp. TaxID=259305 RepID=UPI002591960E|nr:SDR family oxidoreductase [uncultured Kocuria sp.]MCT1367429.1 SDR family oxidoreductase [Rothia sp. p3-SID1597]
MTSPRAQSTHRSHHVAVVTGASSGIGRETARQLAELGWTVYAVARRVERLEGLAEETGVIPHPLDITDADGARELAERVIQEQGTVDTLVNISGAAFGTDNVGEGNPQDWEAMYRLNVLGTLHMVQAFLPALRANGEGTIFNLTSTAAEAAYEGGGGYNAAKFGERALTRALRLEEAEHNVRVLELAPGMVHTEEFSVNRLGGNEDAAEKIYEGVDKPLTAEDVARVAVFSLTLPHHINLDSITMRPVAQAAQHKVIRSTDR